ncbi:DUF4349 domain-containing protein [Mucilaginibacter sp.]|uniref:DUF4349 domain-containing protein n=1 Tax=Mucilaginibacter sp. TaxID=1882438 RepID=UPI0025F65B96|nr:DUF4349 domain-containing protein [Mucilaginibacter sp.]
MKTKHVIPLLAGLGLFCACKGKMDSKSNAADSATSANVVVQKSAADDSVTDEKVVLHKSPTPDSAVIKKVPVHKSHKTDTAQPVRRLVQKADIHFKVKSVQQTTEQVASLTADLKGTIVHQTINSTPQSQQDFKRSDDSIMRVTVTRPTAEMTVKIPPAYLEVFLLQVARLGIHIDSSHMNVNDKTLDYLSTQLKLKNEAELTSTEEQKPAAAKSPRDILELKNRMVDHQIDNRRIADSAKTGVIALSFYENDVVSREILASNNPSSYNEPATKRIGTSIKEGWDVFVDFIALLIKAWVLVPLGLITWVLVKRINKKKAIINLKTNTEL